MKTPHLAMEPLATVNFQEGQTVFSKSVAFNKLSTVQSICKAWTGLDASFFFWHRVKQAGKGYVWDKFVKGNKQNQNSLYKILKELTKNYKKKLDKYSHLNFFSKISWKKQM